MRKTNQKEEEKMKCGTNESNRVGQGNLGGATAGGGGAAGDVLVGGGRAGAATLEEGVHKGEEPEDPRGADEEEGGRGVPRLRESRAEHVDHQEHAAGRHAQEEHGEH